MKSCALTGHRVLERNFPRDALREKLEQLIREGVDTFYCGMAVGFDMLCCEILLSLKEKYAVCVVACIPCADQCARFSPAMKEKYYALLGGCDEKIVLHPHYTEGCMLERNRFMTDRADMLLAYLRSRKGGTYYTVNYAKRTGKKIEYI